jgi:hypothetical protein
MPGEPTTWVECADTDAVAVLDALRAGRVTLSAEPAGPVLIRRGDELLVLDGEGASLLGNDGGQKPIGTPRQTVPALGAGPAPTRGSGGQDPRPHTLTGPPRRAPIARRRHAIPEEWRESHRSGLTKAKGAVRPPIVTISNLSRDYADAAMSASRSATAGGGHGTAATHYASTT